VNAAEKPQGPAVTIEQANAFASDLLKLREDLNSADLNPLGHLKAMDFTARFLAAFGIISACFGVNLFSIAALSLALFIRWTMIAHHVSHGGYDRFADGPAWSKSYNFARGWRRPIDWLDWIHPRAWHYEHNVLHHYYTGEMSDPDLLENNVIALREQDAPVALKWLKMLFFMCTWRWFYYAPKTLWVLQQVERRKMLPPDQRAHIRAITDTPYGTTLPALDLLLKPGSPGSLDLWRRSIMPVLILRFTLIPLLALPLGLEASLSVLICLLLADVVANVHGFLVIVPNHAGNDVHRFTQPVESKADFLVRQVLGSVNFKTGGNVNDILHGWLNYQIEHHLWPDLSMSEYQWLQPRVKQLCIKHDIPYKQESVFVRFRKMMEIAVGNASMLVTRSATSP
jgi:fatty acid desaturase